MIDAIKNYSIGILLILSIIGGVLIYFTNKSNKELKQNWSISENNYKASDRKNIAYELTIDQLKLSEDSLNTKLLDTSKKLGVKNSKINSLMIIIDSLNKIDTIKFRDTIFVANLKVDTIIGDKWIKKKLHLEYPNVIIIDEEIYSEKSIVWSNKRETINPPKKFFLCRWFQAKQTIVEIKIVDANPYFKTREFRYITVIK